MSTVIHLPLAAWPIRMEYMPGWMVLLLFVALALPITWLGIRSLAGLGPVRKWVALGVRLVVLLLFVLLLGGIRWQRTHKDLELMVVRDISDSTAQVRNYPAKTLQASVDDYLKAASAENRKRPDDKIGVISFATNATIEEMPGTRLRLDSRAIREPGSATDAAAAIQLALATLSRDAMHRLLLVWDGNETAGDLEAALTAAISQGVQIDVMPLHYDVKNEILVDKFYAPAVKREKEPFLVDVYLRSTNVTSVTGKLTVFHQGQPLDLDSSTPGIQATKLVTLHPGQNVERVRVPPLGPGVHQFKAIFDAENVTAGVGGPGSAEAGGEKQGDTLLANNSGEAFTFVQGKGKVLYVDNVKEGRGDMLQQALKGEGIDLDRITVDAMPNDLMSLQNYDAVLLVNVPRGAGGLSDEQQRNIATYVHDMGGGLVMVGGEDTFGAGGWQGSRLEEVLPVNMDVPAQREIPKGALVLIMHACEMPDGNYWGEQCALKAAETLSERDEIGVISYNWQGRGIGGVGGAQWDYPLGPKGDGSKVTTAIKNWNPGDMPSFDDAMNVALNGGPGQKGLKDSDARQKHVIIISDGDPAEPNQQLYQDYIRNQVTVSTISVYPHSSAVPPQMERIAKTLKGRAYGPINSNFSQLPQIFIKEAKIVRRSLIYEEREGIRVNQTPTASELMKGLSLDGQLVTGLVLTSVKPNPQVEMPLMAGNKGKNKDPLLAHWQTGLGKAAAFTSDAHNKWTASWAGSATYRKFWAQVVRGVSRAPMSTDFDVQTSQSGDKGRITVNALDKDNGALNFLSIRGQVIGPDGKLRDVRLVQTGPGTYVSEFDTPIPGSYVVALTSRGPKGEVKQLPPAGVAMSASPELRDLHSNDALLEQIAERTGGRVLEPFSPADADLFRRDDRLKITASPLPVWDIVIPILLGLFLVDVATRRIAWDWVASKRFAAQVAQGVRAWTLTRKVESAPTLDALKRVREEVAEQKFKPAQEEGQVAAGTPVGPMPDATAKFEAKGVEGDIAKVVGGAADKPIPAAPKKVEPKGAPAGAPGGHTGSLLEAKRRAQQKMKEREQENQ